MPKTILTIKYPDITLTFDEKKKEINSEPLKVIAADDSVTLAQYELDKDLLDTEGWRRFRGIA